MLRLFLPPIIVNRVCSAFVFLPCSPLCWRGRCCKPSPAPVRFELFQLLTAMLLLLDAWPGLRRTALGVPARVPRTATRQTVVLWITSRVRSDFAACVNQLTGVPCVRKIDPSQFYGNCRRGRSELYRRFSVHFTSGRPLSTWQLRTPCSPVARRRR